jgi:hypothetical protein
MHPSHAVQRYKKNAGVPCPAATVICAPANENARTSDHGYVARGDKQWSSDDNRRFPRTASVHRGNRASYENAATLRRAFATLATVEQGGLERVLHPRALRERKTQSEGEARDRMQSGPG